MGIQRTVPRVFKNSTAEVIAKSRYYQPLAESHILGAGTLADSLATDGKLGTACNTDFLGHFETGEEFLESGLVDVAGVNGLALLGRGFVLNGSDLSRAAKDPDTSQVGVADLLEIVETKVLEERKSIVVGVIVVPLEALGVVEDDVPGQGVVSVNDVAAAH